MKRLFTALCALGAAWGTFPAVAPAAAAPTECSCLAAPAQGVAFGSVLASSGKVTIAGANGVKGAAAGARLPAGASLFTSAKSRASVSFGADCAVQVGENATLIVEQVGGKLCPKVTELSVTSSAPVSYGLPRGGVRFPGGHFPFWVPAGFIALTLTSLIISIADRDHHHGGGPISP